MSTSFRVSKAVKTDAAIRFGVQGRTCCAAMSRTIKTIGEVVRAAAVGFTFMDGGNIWGNILHVYATVTVLTSMSAIKKQQQLFLLRQFHNLDEQGAVRWAK